MGIFANMTTTDLEAAGDRAGGGFEAIPSGVYEATVKVAYVGASSAADSKAQSITLVADIDGKELRETIWISNKAGANFYPDKNDPKKKQPLPGFTTIDDLCLLATGHPLAEQDVEEKVVKIYDYTEKKELPKPVSVITALLGKTVKLGVLRQIVNKQKKNDAGLYVNTDETRTENTIDKVFHAETSRTVTEYRQEVLTPEFHQVWSDKNSGKDRNRVKAGAPAGGIGLAGSGRPGGASAAAKSLFS